MKVVESESAASDFFCDVDSDFEGSGGFPDDDDTEGDDDDYNIMVSFRNKTQKLCFPAFTSN